MFVGFLAWAGFVLVGIVGLLAALRPALFVRYFLQEWQRERVVGNERWIAWTGWIIFGFCMFTVATMLIGELLRR